MKAVNKFLKLNLHLLHCGYIQLGAEWRFEGVISPFCRIYLITEGEAWVYHHQRTFRLRPGFLYLIPSFTVSSYQCDATMTQYYLSLTEETDSGFSMFDMQQMDYEVPALPIDALLFSRLLELNPNRSLQNIDPKVYDNKPDLLSFNQPAHTQSMVQHLETQGILLQLFSRFMQSSDAAIREHEQARIQLGGVLNYIHTHLSEKLTVAQLAALQQVHPDHFSRQFCHLLGIRPIDYINNKRLERAQLLIATSSLPLQTIAEQVGIPDIYYFSRLFKRRFGIPPGRYRKMGVQT
ncbi:AraC family transcriptional regulator [Spirosoma montaniterrae]|uniref:Transcriptional regulator n=1 Tax=Spirosoma montaniterrae TaxID=1178516 RepID=A0A1P9WZB6_9BACT|nr:AraC family transcriptional regulator [Spirosoma montaniterrae]AQG80727.1 transcriptional regulator [Spirosoma montaniterrae]